jgi:hypothetical protein
LNALTKLTPSLPAELELPQSLRWAVIDLLNPSEAVRSPFGPWPQALREQAEQLLHEAERMCEPVSLGQISAWLAPITAAVSNPPPADDLRHRIHAIGMAVAEMPCAAFSQAAQRQAMRTWKFWPSAAEVAALIGPKGNELISQREALRRIAKPPAPPASGQLNETRSSPITAEVAAAIKAKHGVAAPALVEEKPRPDIAPRLPQRTIAEQMRELAATMTPEQIEALCAKSPPFAAAMRGADAA